MWLLAYHNDDRIGFRLLAISEDVNYIISQLERQTKFDKGRVKKHLKDGIFITESNFYVIRTFPKPVPHSGLPYGYNKITVDNLWQLAVASARNEKINKIL